MGGFHVKYLLSIMLVLVAQLSWAQTTNQAINIAQSAAQTATTVNFQDQTNSNLRGGHIIINVSSFTSGTYTPHLQGKDPISGVYYDILVGPALSATGTTVLKVYPGIGVVANGSASDILPLTWRVQLIGASTPSMTLSIDAFLEN